MARFSDLRAALKQEPAFDTTIPRALLTPAVIASTADGEIDDAEILQLRNLIVFNPTFHGMAEQDLDTLTNSIVDALMMDGREVVLKACVEALPGALYQTAFSFAVFVVMADGVLADREQSVLAEIAAAMNLRPQAVERICHVIRTMQYTAEI